MFLLVLFCFFRWRKQIFQTQRHKGAKYFKRRSKYFLIFRAFGLDTLFLYGLMRMAKHILNAHP